MLHHLPTLSLATLEEHMVLVEGGTIENRDGDKVDVNSFQLCRFPANQLLWQEVMDKDPEELKFQGLHRPVERVSWHDCQQFIRILNQQTQSKYRLPWQVEWVYAAKEGQYQRGFEFAGSNRLQEVGWYFENSFLETIPAGYRLPNAFGLYDLSGNVEEWCQDELSDNRRIRCGGNWAAHISGVFRAQLRIIAPGSLKNGYLGFRLARSL